MVLAGPHKAASTWVQRFFFLHASSHPPRSRRLPAFQNWTWPHHSPKGFAKLVTGDESSQALILQGIREAWNANTSSSSLPTTTNNFVLGSEEFDRVGTTPSTHRDGIRAIFQIINATTTTTTDLDLPSSPNTQIVVNYRRPRRDHWLSIWKEVAQNSASNPSYQDFMCSPIDHISLWEILDCVANPFGLVQSLLQQQQPHGVGGGGLLWKVDLMDMQGISRAGKDIAHATACHILGGIPCENGRVQGVGDADANVFRNQRSGDPDLTPQQLDDMEWLLRQRDCTYREQFLQCQELGVLSIHFGDTIWDGCDPNNQSNRDFFVNTTLLFELFQRQVGCGNLRMGPTIGELRQGNKPAHQSRLSLEQLQGQQRSNTLNTTVPKELNSVNEDNESSSKKDPGISLSEANHLHLYLVPLLPFFALLLNRIGFCKGHKRRPGMKRKLSNNAL